MYVLSFLLFAACVVESEDSVGPDEPVPFDHQMVVQSYLTASIEDTAGQPVRGAIVLVRATDAFGAVNILGRAASNARGDAELRITIPVDLSDSVEIKVFQPSQGFTTLPEADVVAWLDDPTQRLEVTL